jgi:energy-coupling factor transport system permease protein
MSLTRLDPRVKLLLLVGLSTASLVTSRTVALLALLLLALLILLAGGVKPLIVWIKVRGLISLVAMLFFLQCLFDRSGEALLVISGFTLIFASGFQTAALVSLRLLIVILSALTVSVGESRDYLLALTQCKVPYELAFMVLAALRFLPMLREEAIDVLNAAQMRGLKIKKAGLVKQAGAYISIVIPVVASAVRRAEQLSIAMEARGFRAFPHRTNMRRLQMRAIDWTYATVFCTALASILLLSVNS